MFGQVVPVASSATGRPVATVETTNRVWRGLSASRGYEANATAVETLKQMAQRGIEI